MSDAVADQDVTKALAFEREKNAVLLEQVVQLEDELVNRSMTEYAGEISEESRDFWKQQLVSNREGAVRVLNEMRSARLAVGDRGSAGGDAGAAGASGTGAGRQPLHNRGGKVRQGSPTGGAAGAGPAAGDGAGGADGVAARIRNRAHALCKAEGIAFSTAFRRAERELSEG